MLVPVEMRTPFPERLQDGVFTTTTVVWETLTAAREGRLDRLSKLVDNCRSLVHCEYNYMPPLHLAVREGHRDVVRWLLGRGAANPKYVNVSRAGHRPVRVLERGHSGDAPNSRHHKMIDMLLRYGATVPSMTKWGREYFFKHDDIAAELMSAA